MKLRWTALLERTDIFRWIFFLAGPLSFFIDRITSQRDVVIVMNIAILLLSALSFRKAWVQVITSGIMSIVGALHMPEFVLQMTIFQWLWSFVMASFFMILIERYLGEKRNIIDLVTSLANTLDSRDPYTAHHSQNVANYSRAIAEELKLKKNICQDIYFGGLLHDIGKVGIPEAVLNKQERLTEEEYKKIQEHPEKGYQLVKHIKSFSRNGIHDMIRFHHERYDGKGYPQGLKGDEIPLPARIMAVADTFDAMTSKRVYREAISLKTTLDEINKNSGTQFDPNVVEAFMRVMEKDANHKSQLSYAKAKNPMQLPIGI